MIKHALPVLLSPVPTLHAAASANAFPRPAVRAATIDDRLMGERDVWLLAKLLQRRAAYTPGWDWAQADHPLPRRARA